MSQDESLVEDGLRGVRPHGDVKLFEGSNGAGASSAKPAVSEHSPWLMPGEAARRARCGVKIIYREVRAGRLRAARIGGRRELRLKPEWVDEWLVTTTAPTER